MNEMRKLMETVARPIPHASISDLDTSDTGPSDFGLRELAKTGDFGEHAQLFAEAVEAALDGRNDDEVVLSIVLPIIDKFTSDGLERPAHALRYMLDYLIGDNQLHENKEEELEKELFSSDDFTIRAIGGGESVNRGYTVATSKGHVFMYESDMDGKPLYHQPLKFFDSLAAAIKYHEDYVSENFLPAAFEYHDEDGYAV
jgi:hypothetical protein